MRFPVLLALLCAVATGQRAVAPFPLHLDAGWRATLAGRFDEARAEYATCFEWSPRNATVAFHLACLERDAGAADAAAAWLMRAAEWGYADAAFARAEFGGVERCAEALAAFAEPLERAGDALDVRWVAATRAPLLAPDGLRVMLAGEVLWDLEAGVPIAVFAEGGSYGGARFAEDGRRLVTWTRPGELTLRDGSSGQPLRKLWPPVALDAPALNDYAHVSVRADLRLAFVARGGHDGYLVDLESGTPRYTVRPRGGRVQRAALADDCARLMIVAGDTLTVLDTATGGETLVATDIGRGSHALALQGSYGACVAQGNERVTVIDLARDVELGRIEGAASACIHPDETVLVAWHPAGRLVWYSLPALELVHEQPVPSDFPYALQFDPSGQRLLISQRTAGVRVIAAAGGEPRELSELRAGWGNRFSFDAACARLAAESGQGTRILDATTGALLESIESPANARPNALAGAGVAAVARANGEVALLRLRDGATIRVLPGSGEPVRFLESDHTQRRLLVQDHAQRVAVHDIRTGAQLTHFAGARFAQLSLDGELVYTFGDEQGLRVFEVLTGALVAHLGAGEIFDQAAWDDAGARAVTRDEAHRARVWDVDEGRELCDPLVLLEGVSSLALDPAGRFVALGTKGEQLSVHDVASGRQVARLEARGSFPFGVETRELSFSPDGTLLVATTGDAGTVQCWDAGTWGRRWSYDQGGGNPSSIAIAFTRDGQRVCTFGMGLERVFDARTGKTLVDLGARRLWTLRAGEALLLASEFDGSVLVLDGERLLYRRVEVAGGALLVHPHGILGGEPSALREVFVSRGEVGEPADCYAALLFDPRRATADPALVGPPMTAALPVLAYGADTERSVTCGAAEARLEVRASGVAGVVGALVAVDGVWLAPDEVEWTAAGLARVTVRRRADGAPRRVVFRARDERGLLSVPLRVTLRFSGAR